MTLLFAILHYCRRHSDSCLEAQHGALSIHLRDALSNQVKIEVCTHMAVKTHEIMVEDHMFFEGTFFFEKNTGH